VVGIGTVLVPALTGYLAGVRWDYPFLLFLLGILVAAVVYTFLAEPLRDPDRRETLAETVRAYGSAVRTELSDRSFAILLCGRLTRGVNSYALLTFVPLFAVSTLNAGLLAAGLLLSMHGLVYMLLSPLAGPLVARYGRKDLLITSLGTCGLALAAIPFAPSLPWLAGAVVLHTIGDAVYDPVNKGAVR
jgi:MFS family permease